MTAHGIEALTTSERLARLARDAETEAETEARAEADTGAKTVTLGWILGQLRERAFGLFLLVLALPCCIPFLYGVPQVVALPLLFVSGQVMIGRRLPWLPARLAARRVSTGSLQSLSQRAAPWLVRIEAVSRPRLAVLTHRPLDQLVGLALVVFSASILVPLPGTNTVPGIAVVIVAMGLLQRDGLMVILGGMLGSAWIATLIVAGATLTSLLRGWLGI
ncbi:exopolysaccharide biosynthesis protein [Roseicyclus amphidinii]|uniref:exopolysaccharide biosynthesis protein n=1 Tax=Roseicyclus amphidinii TaxID=3034232 RepID=UPI0024E04F79|nr:exopolysaccharide biosynthesis protein [Roseicyclus sp. Amp-Y-6]